MQSVVDWLEWFGALARHIMVVEQRRCCLSDAS